MARFITPGKSPNKYARFYKTPTAGLQVVIATTTLNGNNLELQDITTGLIASTVSLNSNSVELQDIVSSSISSLVSLNASPIESKETATGLISSLISLNGSNLELTDLTNANIASIVSLNASPIESKDVASGVIASNVALTSASIESNDSTSAIISSLITLTSAQNELLDVANGLVSTQVSLNATALEPSDVASGVAIAVITSLNGASIESNDIVFAVMTTATAGGGAPDYNNKYLVRKGKQLIVFKNKIDALNALNNQIEVAEIVVNNVADIDDIKQIVEPPIQPVNYQAIYDVNLMLQKLQDERNANQLVSQRLFEQLIQRYETLLDDEDEELLLLIM